MRRPHFPFIGLAASTHCTIHFLPIFANFSLLNLSFFFFFFWKAKYISLLKLVPGVNHVHKNLFDYVCVRERPRDLIFLAI